MTERVSNTTAREDFTGTRDKQTVKAQAVTVSEKNNQFPESQINRNLFHFPGGCESRGVAVFARF